MTGFDWITPSQAGKNFFDFQGLSVHVLQIFPIIPSDLRLTQYPHQKLSANVALMGIGNLNRNVFLHHKLVFTTGIGSFKP